MDGASRAPHGVERCDRAHSCPDDVGVVRALAAPTAKRSVPLRAMGAAVPTAESVDTDRLTDVTYQTVSRNLRRIIERSFVTRAQPAAIA
jgi:hypothetical protein